MATRKEKLDNRFIKCKECEDYLPPNFMLWNEVCVFCWFYTSKSKGKTKAEVKRRME